MGGIGDAINGIGDAFGGIGDAFGGFFGEDTTAKQNNQGVTYSVVETNNGYIQVVPAATQNYAVTSDGASTQAVSSTASANTAETVDFAATKNPYQKPTGELRGGDTGEGVKWMQWIFIYTRYGLKDDGITGVFDEDTMAVVKKLQKENNLPVDGIVNDAVIDKIELLYYQATYTQPAFIATTSASGTKLTTPVVVPEQDNTVIILLVVLIVLVWIVAIAFVVTMVIKNKKKKAQSQKKTESSQSSSEENK
ncbi:MAG: peptidoglycan-binding protein [Clostridia bacterium]|nr:peptidoglycan-binding protein [Clostridia bacterium]